ncbi:hypothetical protein [Streptomyces filamentosus]|uniref:hypothetical protein n=1 Tax=Streptomyces filamentosus TaxID=67294 RepID=UPI0033FB71D0
MEATEGDAMENSQKAVGDQPRRRAATVHTRCRDCGEAIEVDLDGFRTLCACDAAE